MTVSMMNHLIPQTFWTASGEIGNNKNSQWINFTISSFTIIEQYIQGKPADLPSPNPDNQPVFHQYSHLKV